MIAGRNYLRAPDDTQIAIGAPLAALWGGLVRAYFRAFPAIPAAAAWPAGPTPVQVVL